MTEQTGTRHTEMPVAALEERVRVLPAAGSRIVPVLLPARPPDGGTIPADGG